MQTTTRKWTFEEVKGFSEWDKKRKDGKLGVPVRFETVSELESWLHEQKWSEISNMREKVANTLIPIQKKIEEDQKRIERGNDVYG